MQQFFQKLAHALYCEIRLTDAERDYAHDQSNVILRDAENAAQATHLSLKDYACQQARDNQLTDELAEFIDNSNSASEAFELVQVYLEQFSEEHALTF